MSSFKVTVRSGPKVEHERFAAAGEAIDWVEARGRRLQDGADGRAVSLPLGRGFDPVQRVVARIEVAGPRRARAGIDVRGDGSAEGWTGGRLRRTVIEQRSGESAYDALRRSLEAAG